MVSTGGWLVSIGATFDYSLQEPSVIIDGLQAWKMQVGSTALLQVVKPLQALSTVGSQPGTGAAVLIMVVSSNFYIFLCYIFT